MDRRRFLNTCGSVLTACDCSFARHASASTAKDCRAAGAGDHFRAKVRQTAGISFHDTLVQTVGPSLIRTFKVHPGIGFYDDVDGPNALAFPEALLPDGTDGTVLMGLRLLSLEMQRLAGPIHPTPGDLGGNWVTAPVIVMAHEFGHITQY
jgi:hypothetical protein